MKKAFYDHVLPLLLTITLTVAPILALADKYLLSTELPDANAWAYESAANDSSSANNSTAKDWEAEQSTARTLTLDGGTLTAFGDWYTNGASGGAQTVFGATSGAFRSSAGLFAESYDSVIIKNAAVTTYGSYAYNSTAYCGYIGLCESVTLQNALVTTTGSPLSAIKDGFGQGENISIANVSIEGGPLEITAFKNALGGGAMTSDFGTLTITGSSVAALAQ